jgi:hypothetical protein
MGELQELVERFYGAFNNNDLDAAMTCFTDALVAVDQGGGEKHGAVAWRKFGAMFKAAAPDARLNLRTAVEAGDTIFVEGTFTGTFTGPMQTPQGEAPPTGNAFALGYVDMFVARGDRFAQQRVYYDQMEFLAQLGLLPEGAAAD